VIRQQHGQFVALSEVFLVPVDKSGIFSTYPQANHGQFVALFKNLLLFYKDIFWNAPK